LDAEADGWELCLVKTDGDEKLKDWMCPINAALGNPCSGNEPPEIPTITVIQKQPMIIISSPSPDCALDWNYRLHGENWQCRCSEGFE